MRPRNPRYAAMAMPSQASRIRLAGHPVPKLRRHRPQGLTLAGLSPRLLLRRSRPVRPCQAGPAIAARRRLRQRLIEATLTALATTFLTSLALAQPAVLRDAPATTWQKLTLPAVGTPLIDCP